MTELILLPLAGLALLLAVWLVIAALDAHEEYPLGNWDESDGW